ncbi:MAG: MYXO-CTERM sorting domain-containing protein [Polyangiaceae bacterium]
MSYSKSSRHVSRVISLLVFLGLSLLASLAWAAGRVEWTSKAIKETDSSGGSWKLEIKVFLASAPDVAHVPVKFEFTPVAYYERAMMDGDKLVERRVPLTGRQDIIESVDLGFLDPGTGKLEKRTRFSFKVTRAHGFEAGEYKVQIRNARNGQLIGSAVTLKLEGENETIDRRAMVFASPGDKKKKEEKKEESSEGSDSSKEEGSESTEPSENTEPAETDTPSDAPDDPPQEIKEKPGGCGCRLEGTREPGAPEGLAALGLVALLVLRRRR